MATASLMGMPLELLVHMYVSQSQSQTHLTLFYSIAKYLPTKDLGALRLTSKYLEKSLFDVFAKEFFVKKQFMLTTPSLQTLVDISKHGALNASLTHCIIGLESYEHSSLPAPALNNDAQREAFRAGFVDQIALLSSGRALHLLTEAFRRLPNLEILGIRDYESPNRVRDGNKWRSYGVSTVFHDTTCNLQTGSSRFASEVFLLLMQALANAHRDIPCVETILRTRSTGLSDPAFFLPPPGSKMDRVICGLQQLLLTINFNPVLEHRHNTLSVFSGSVLFESFLERASSLKHLRLNFQQHVNQSHTLMRLIATPSLLPDLQRLDLGMLCVNPSVLVDFLSKFSATIRHVSFWKVRIDYDPGNRWNDDEERFNPWPSVFRDIMSATRLTSMSVGCINQSDGPGGGNIQLRFSNRISGDYVGDMKAWLPRLLDELEVLWPQPVQVSDFSSEDDEDEEDDEDDDSSSDEDDES